MNKKTITLVMMLLLAVMGVKAQTWTASEFGVGNFYLYNVGAGKYLNGGNAWGTHASLNYVGIETEIIKIGETTTYRISTASCYGSGKYIGGDGYVDNSTAGTFTIETVEGETNTYLFKLGSNYMVWGGTGTDLSFVAAKPTTSNGYWKLVTKTNLVADMTANATSANGIDASFYIKDPEFGRNAVRGWEGEPSLSNFPGKNNAYVNQNWAAEKWNTTYDVYQTIASVPNGRYKLSCYGLYRAGSDHSDATTQNAMIYANDETSYIQNSRTNAPSTNRDGCTVQYGTEPNIVYVPNTQADASLAIGAGLYEGNDVTVDVTVGELRIGVKKTVALTNDWTIFDKFSLTFYGTNLANDAIALPNTVLTADTWYYFDIPSDDNYDLTVTTLNDVVYTKDGSVLTENAASSVTTNFSGTSEVALTTGRYYIRSASAQTFSVAAHSNTYDLGSLTAQSISEGEYIKGLTTLVLTYGNATTNDLGASLAVIGSSTAKLKKNGSDVASGTLTADNTAKTLTATFSEVDLTINSTDYSIVIPAGAFGYEGQSVNSEVTVNFNTPLFADGNYYMKNKKTGAYFNIGSSYGTRSMNNNIGHIVGLVAQTNGTFTFDTGIYNTNNNASMHYLGTNLYCDQSAYNWTFAKDGDYYTITDAGSNFLNASAIDGDISLASGSAGDDAKWSLLTVEEWKTAQVSTLASATAETPVDATFYIPGANLSRGDKIENGKWNGSPTVGGLDKNMNGEKFNTSSFDVYQELTGLKPGTYKLTADGFYRNGTTDDRNAILYANTAEVALVNIRSTQIASSTGGFTTANGDYYVPNSQTDASNCFNASYYDNELTFTVGSEGTLRVGVKKTLAAANDWAVFDNFQLQYYGVVLDESKDFSETADIDKVNVTVNRTMTANVWNTLVVPFDMAIPSGWTVKEPTAFADGTLTFGDASSIVAGKPYIVKPTEAVTSFSATGVTLKKDLVNTTVGTGTTVTMRGTYEKMDAIDYASQNSYVVGIKDGVSSLYKVTSDVSLKPFRAYFTVEGGAGARISLSFGDEATDVQEFKNSRVEGLKSYFDLQGRKVMNPTKGLYIVGGKKVIVK